MIQQLGASIPDHIYMILGVLFLISAGISFSRKVMSLAKVLIGLGLYLLFNGIISADSLFSGISLIFTWIYSGLQWLFGLFV